MLQSCIGSRGLYPRELFFSGLLRGPIAALEKRARTLAYQAVLLAPSRVFPPCPRTARDGQRCLAPGGGLLRNAIAALFFAARRSHTGLYARSFAAKNALHSRCSRRPDLPRTGFNGLPRALIAALEGAGPRRRETPIGGRHPVARPRDPGSTESVPVSRPVLRRGRSR